MNIGHRFYYSYKYFFFFKLIPKRLGNGFHLEKRVCNYLRVILVNEYS